jgi:hypothetical protein
LERYVSGFLYLGFLWDIPSLGTFSLAIFFRCIKILDSKRNGTHLDPGHLQDGDGDLLLQQNLAGALVGVLQSGRLDSMHQLAFI